MASATTGDAKAPIDIANHALLGEIAWRSGDLDGGIWSTGQSQALIHDIPTCAELVRNIMGQADQIINLAQTNARALGLQPWLDAPGPDGLRPGNNAAVLLVLANAGLYKLDKAEAAKQLAAWMQSPEYRAGGRNALVAVRMLSQVAYRDAAPSVVTKTTKGAVEQAKREQSVVQRRAAADKEAGELLQQMRNGTRGQRAAAEAEWITLTAKL